MQTQNFDDLPDSARVRWKTLQGVVPISYVSVWRHVKKGTFPKPIALGEGGRCLAWKVGDIRAWLAAREQHASGNTGGLQ
jgi:predicted DNA-binding transcriptional regulator AlpA